MSILQFRDREQYEEDLKNRQAEHLRKVQESTERRAGRKTQWRPCMHDGCEQCCGTGIKKDGTRCNHYYSCPCPKCNPNRVA